LLCRAVAIFCSTSSTTHWLGGITIPQERRRRDLSLVKLGDWWRTRRRICSGDWRSSRFR
jgi:hypothetical protein